ncbi:hypothetical protein ACU4GD_32045 [Cupriavidus basilensis]
MPANTLRQCRGAQLGFRRERCGGGDRGRPTGGLPLAAFGAASDLRRDLLSCAFVIAGRRSGGTGPSSQSIGCAERLLQCISRRAAGFTRAHSKLHVVLARTAVHPRLRQQCAGASVAAGRAPTAACAAAPGLKWRDAWRRGGGCHPRRAGHAASRRKRLDADGLVLLSAVVTAIVMAALACCAARVAGAGSCYCCWARRGSWR